MPDAQPSTQLFVSERIRAVADPSSQELVQRVLRVAQAGLPQMTLSDPHRFVFTLAEHSAAPPQDGVVLRPHGESLRYAAIVLLGARCIDEDAQRAIFGGATAVEYCGRLLNQIEDVQNLGDVALVTWAAAEIGHSNLGKGIGKLRERLRASAHNATLEIAWALSALSAAQLHDDFSDDAVAVRERLLLAHGPHEGTFGHHTDDGHDQWFRQHVGSFADQVYPLQALARFHRAFGDSTALAIASAVGDSICRLQGDGGQWWWHYDRRSGKVVEGYPVYSVHQDAMAPMALFDLHECGGRDYSREILHGLSWMEQCAEFPVCLIDDEQKLIWRKIARREPNKLTRGVRATSTRVSAGLNLSFLDMMFRPRQIDRESRPYHLGWILYAWLSTLR
ncbi:MAG: hypothetical protein AAF581_01220 [Planctomycetota bacterium]